MNRNAKFIATIMIAAAIIILCPPLTLAVIACAAAYLWSVRNG